MSGLESLYLCLVAPFLVPFLFFLKKKYLFTFGHAVSLLLLELFLAVLHGLLIFCFLIPLLWKMGSRLPGL